MSDLLFGLFLNPSRARSGSMLANTRAAEQAGFDYISVQDHPYVSEFLDPLVLIAALIGRTERIRFMTNVSNLPLRPPAMLAKAGATLDVLSGGRFELGLGGGRTPDGIAALGGQPGRRLRSYEPSPRRSPSSATCGTARRKASPTSSCSRSARSGRGQRRRIGSASGSALPGHGCSNSSDAAPMAGSLLLQPALRPSPPRSTASTEQPWGPADPSDIRRVIQLVAAVTDRPATQQRPLRGPGNQPLRTTAEIWAEIIAQFVVDERFDTVNLIPQQETPEQIAAFGEQVIPLARDAVNARRANPLLAYSGGGSGGGIY